MQTFFMIILILTALSLILIILVQRGKGGGLAGAFGGMGGQSAFGTKAGDTFTKFTIGLATFWIILCVVSVAVLRTSSKLNTGVTNTANAPAKQTAPSQPDKGNDQPAEPAKP